MRDFAVAIGQGGEMNITVAALLGLSLAQPAQPPAADYYPINARRITLPIEYKKDKSGIRQVQLFVCENGDQVWKLATSAPPTQDSFTYTAPADGLYWFHIVVVDLKGDRDPANLTAEPPAMKALLDATKPLVRFTNARRAGDEVIVEWEVDDKFPNDAATKVSFRRASAPADQWQEVTLPPNSRNGVRFSAGTPEAVTVKVAVADLAGNSGEAQKEVGGLGTSTSTSMSPGIDPARPGPAIPPPSSIIPTDVPGPAMPTGPVAPVAPPVTPPPSTGTGPVVPPTTTPVSPPSMPTYDPRNTAAPPPTTGGLAMAPGTGAGPAAAPVQTINSLRFEINYQVEERGPSGISRVDLWVTRDEGRSWVWWSQHPGQESPVKVNLATQANAQPEGSYGFRLVPVSGAGLSAGTPVAGDAPDIRIVVDVTAPVVKMFPPAADPAAPGALVLQWEAADRNFGDDPITLEWSESPAGPWHPVSAAARQPLIAAGGVEKVSTGSATAPRLPNTGRHSWRVAPGTPPRVYLKLTARDSAGNVTEQVTRDPVLIDLTKPRARITGIETPVGVRP